MAFYLYVRKLILVSYYSEIDYIYYSFILFYCKCPVVSKEWLLYLWGTMSISKSSSIKIGLSSKLFK
jgi:hypothetical protein